MNTVLFDMDGTLLDTLQDLDTAVNYALARAGLPAVTADQTRQAAGYASVYLMEELSQHVYPSDSAEFKALWQDFMDHYAAHHNDATKPYAGIPELLSALKERGFKVGVVSNKADADVQALRQLWFADTIQAGLGYTPRLPRKPAPDMVFAVLDKLGSKPEETYYLGDSEPDVQIARNAGCVAVSCAWGFRARSVLEAEKPDYIIEHPLEFLDVLKGEGHDRQREASQTAQTHRG